MFCEMKAVCTIIELKLGPLVDLIFHLTTILTTKCNNSQFQLICVNVTGPTQFGTNNIK